MTIHVPEAVAVKLAHLPDGPGVYLWKDAAGVVLYVGKAKNLRSRVRSYFSPEIANSAKTTRLVRLIASLDTIVVPTEANALVLEATLIKEYKPRFNIHLRDDKSYPYIVVTVQEAFPRVLVTRRFDSDGARYFGPYTDVGQMRRALAVVNRIFTVRSCHYDLLREVPERPCLDYHIGRCKAPCALLQTQQDYRAMIDEVVLFLDGRTSEVIARVTQRMQAAADALQFEHARELRDALRHLTRMEEPTAVVQVEGGDRDVIGYARDGDDACIVVLRIRDGKLVGRDQCLLNNAEDEADAAVLSAYLAGAYRQDAARARELLMPFDPADRETLEIALDPCRIAVPQRGPRRELIALAEQNARHLLEELKLTTDAADERAASPVYSLQRDLGLQRLPRSLVCFDISTAQGTDTVGSCVWFENGRPKRGEYRKFTVKTVEGTDDFASMREVVTRYFTRRINEKKPLPDLVLIDGGKGQLGVAHDVLVALGLDATTVVSLAKREEEVFVVGRSESVRLSRRAASLRLLQQARDEAHRFAITYNRKRRSLRTLTSELLSIPGVGAQKRSALLHVFGSLQGVREAAIADIAAIPGFSEASATRILKHLGVPIENDAPTADGEPTDALA